MEMMRMGDFLCNLRFQTGLVVDFHGQVCGLCNSCFKYENHELLNPFVGTSSPF